VAGETELLGENPPQFCFGHHKSDMIWPELEPRPPWWDPSFPTTMSASRMLRNNHAPIRNLTADLIYDRWYFSRDSTPRPPKCRSADTDIDINTG
jgi:hypothetical protein